MLSQVAAVNLDRDDLVRNLGFTAVELRRVHRLVVEHQARLLETWNGYFRRAAW